MDYTGKKCPICSETFTAEDDVVVCPKCGAPYHRSCYEQEGRCIFLDLHRSKESWKDESDNVSPVQETDTKTKRCKFCGHMNDENAVACEQCGRGFIEYQYPNMNTDRENNENPDFDVFPGFGGMPIKIDLMAGVKPDEDFDGVSGEELSKYVKNNTVYYMGIFKRLKDKGKSRFNFAAFLFGGGWMLYRKQYVSGGIITAIMAVLSIAMNYIYAFHSYNILQSVVPNLSTRYTLTELLNELSKLPNGQGWIAILPYILSALNFALMIIIGFTANRTYYKFSIKNIKKIKKQQTSESVNQISDNEEATVENKKTLNEMLMEKGGTNNGLAVCLLVCDVLLSFLPSFFIR